MAWPTAHEPVTRLWTTPLFTASVTSPPAPPPVRPAPAATPVTSPITGDGSGRGLPPLDAPGVKANVPLLPAVSRQVPLNVASEIAASTLTGVAWGDATTLRPMPIEPSGF